MSNSILSEKWEELSSNPSKKAGILRLRLEPDRFHLYAGWQVPENLPALIIEVNTEDLPSGTDIPHTSGLEVLIEPLETGRSGRVRIILKIKNQNYHDIPGGKPGHAKAQPCRTHEHEPG